jgi:transporter family-2 protein
MNAQAFLLTLCAVAAGAFIAFQSPINAAMAIRLGHPLAGAALSFTVGAVTLLLLTALFARDAVNPAVLWSLGPVLLLGGGLLGAMYVFANIMLTPRIGVAAVVALAIAGQVVASLLIDRYGFMGLDVRDLSPGRLAGAAMVLSGALMVRFL